MTIIITKIVKYKWKKKYFVSVWRLYYKCYELDLCFYLLNDNEL